MFAIAKLVHCTLGSLDLRAAHYLWLVESGEHRDVLAVEERCWLESHACLVHLLGDLALHTRVLYHHHLLPAEARLDYVGTGLVKFLLVVTDQLHGRAPVDVVRRRLQVRAVAVVFGVHPRVRLLTLHPVCPRFVHWGLNVDCRVSLSYGRHHTRKLVFVVCG